MRPWLYITILAAAAGSQLGATDCGQALRDSGFDLWCGDTLCAWKVERGDIKRVPTWNEGDSGVELVGSDVAIEQLSPVTSSDGTCLEVDMIANVDDDADVELDVDISDDGTIEHSERVPTSHWKPLTYQIAIAPPFSGVRFEIAKTGTGTAQLANIGAKVVDGCGGILPVVQGPAPLGEPCIDGTGCASGLCAPSPLPTPFDDGTSVTQVCVACTGDAACGTGKACAVTDAVSPVRAAPVECVAAGSKGLGDQCSEGAECATGICNAFACSTCSETSPCADGETCGASWPTPFGIYTAYVCSPGGHVRTTGEPCAQNADCKSGTCIATGVRMQCDDGRACATAADCPFVNLQNGPCNLVGLEGGTCQ